MEYLEIKGVAIKTLRIITIGFLLSIVFIPPLLAAPAFVDSQSFACTNSPCPANSYEFTYTGADEGGMLVLTLRSSAEDDYTVASSGETWVKDAEGVLLGWTFQVWRASNVAAGNHTITITKDSGTTYYRVVVLEFSDMGETPTVEDYSVNSYPTSNNSSVTTPDLTTTKDNTVLFCTVGSDSDNITWSAGTNFTLRNSCPTNGEPDQKLCTESREPVDAGTYSNGMTLDQANGNDSRISVFIAYAPSETPANAIQGVTIN